MARSLGSARSVLCEPPLRKPYTVRARVLPQASGKPARLCRR
ncbi:hypothetical protein [Rhodanobacter sp. C05]|nr:hypothetical protein [Rhodanobacter sp. C05]